MGYDCCKSVAEFNTYQTVFFVFFAIFWGGIFNVQGKYKAFQLPLVCEAREIACRVFLSIIMLNILPAIYFVKVLSLLRHIEMRNSYWILLFTSIPSSLGILGFYRGWLGIIELWPNCFYRNKRLKGKYGHVEPVYLLKLNRGKKKEAEPYIYLGDSSSGWKNLFWAFIYIGAGFSTPWITLNVLD